MHFPRSQVRTQIKTFRLLCDQFLDDFTLRRKSEDSDSERIRAYIWGSDVQSETNGQWLHCWSSQ
jgi:hypothetical protein